MTVVPHMQDRAGRVRVQVVEDEIVVSEDLQQRLIALGFDVVGAADTGADALALAELARPDVVLMDIMLHGKPEGIAAAAAVRERLNIPVIFLTAHSDSGTLQKAKLTDPAGYIVKPFDDAQLRVALELAPARHALEQKALQAARWLAATLSSVGDAVVATNAQAEILLLNPAAERLTGWSQGEAMGRPCAEVVRLVGDGGPLPDPATCALRSGVVVRLDPDTVLLTRAGDKRYVDDSASPITDATGKILGAVVVLIDSTDRVTARGRVETLTLQVAELMAEKDKQVALSGEMEAFAAAVSHDLRSPLAAISGFSYLLAERHRERLDPSGQKFLDYVRTSALQMERMVEDYLAFLKANREQASHMGPVDLGALALAEYNVLNCQPGARPASFNCGQLPPAWGDEGMLRQVLANLLGNALKYSARRELPVIEVGATADTGATTYYVRDNGVGFDLAATTGLFEPFHRFHSAAEFAGSGVGLAIVRRIVERHGGRLWAESRPDAGATFFFSLPAGAA